MEQKPFLKAYSSPSNQEIPRILEKRKDSLP
jgi:hypothetical protein